MSEFREAFVEVIAIHGFSIAVWLALLLLEREKYMIATLDKFWIIIAYLSALFLLLGSLLFYAFEEEDYVEYADGLQLILGLAGLVIAGFIGSQFNILGGLT